MSKVANGQLVLVAHMVWKEISVLWIGPFTYRLCGPTQLLPIFRYPAAASFMPFEIGMSCWQLTLVLIDLGSCKGPESSEAPCWDLWLWGAGSNRGRNTKVAADVTKNCHQQYYYQTKISNHSDTKTKYISLHVMRPRPRLADHSYREPTDTFGKDQVWGVSHLMVAKKT